MMNFPLLKNYAHRNRSSRGDRGKGRLLRLETLEDRRLLSVTAEEYEAIRVDYAEFNLPESMNDVNVIEITAENLSLANLKAAIRTAGQTTSDDLIVIRTTSDSHSLTFTSAADEIAVEINSTYYGKLSIVATGTVPLTIDAMSQATVLSVSAGTDLQVGNFIFTGGDSSAGLSRTDYGGGVYNAGTLALSNGSIVGNVAASSGGGVFNSGSLTITDVKITGNEVRNDYGAYGGGVYNSGTLTGVDSLIADNVAGGANAYGGGLYNWRGTAVLSGVTVTGNSAAYGGGIHVYGIASAKYSVTLYNSILATNVASAESGGNDLYRFNSRGTADAYYVLSSYDGWNSSESVLTYDDSLPLFLSDGSYRLTSGSQAIDVGKNDYVTRSIDLAGNTRIVNGSGLSMAIVDLGAYEFQGTEPGSAVVTTNLDVVDAFDGVTSLREAIAYVSGSSATTKTVKFDANFFTGGERNRITLTNGEIELASMMMIDASTLSERVTIDAASQSRIFNVKGGTAETPVILRDLILTGGHNDNNGGAILVSGGVLQIENLLFTGNSANFGASIFNLNGMVILNDSVITNNSALRGAAIYGYGGGVRVNRSKIFENEANYGAALYNSGGSMVVVASEFEENVASRYGGAVYNLSGTVAVHDSLFAGNSAVYGGAFFDSAGELILVGNTISANMGTSYGGGIFVTGTAATDETEAQLYEVTLYNSILVGNSGGDVVRNNRNGEINALNTLSSYSAWDNAETEGVTNYVYDSTRPLFTDVATGDFTLCAGSQGVDRGSNDYVSSETDLAGQRRTVNRVVDLGAYEFQKTIVTTEQDVIDDSDGLLSLREAITCVVDGSSVEKAITFYSGLQGKTITLSADLGELTVPTGMTIDATGLAGGMTIDAGKNGRVFNVTGGTTDSPVVMSGLTVTGGRTSANGAGIANSGVLTLSDSLVVGNVSTGIGGGLYNSGDLSLVNVTVAGNTASSGGGLATDGDGVVSFAFTAYNSILATNTSLSGLDGDADIFRSGDETLNAFNTLSTFTDWDNAGEVGVVNYAYDPEQPLFENASENDYVLTAGSQAVDVGKNSFVTVDNDLLWNPRIANGTVDLGAYEYQLGSDPGDLLSLAETLTLQEGGYRRCERIGNGDYGAKDVDLFRWEISESDLTKIFYLTFTCPWEGTSFDAYLRFFDAEGNQIGFADNSGTGNYPVTSWTPSSAGTYYLGVSGAGNITYDPDSLEDRSEGAVGDYLLTITSAERVPIESVTLSETDPLCVGAILTFTVDPLDSIYTYQWLRGTDPENLSPVEGAALSYYEITAEDVGCYLGVTVAGYRESYGTASAITTTPVLPFTKSLVVDSLLDVADPDDGFTTLREAIDGADDGDVITFAPSLAGGTITLSGYALTIAKTIEIDASALEGGITISANNLSRGVIVTGGSSDQDVALRNMTITGGSGSGIYNGGFLTMVNCVVTGNTGYFGGGIYNYRSESTGADGGVLTVIDSVISSNSANYGAGIYTSGGILNLTGSQVTKNSAYQSGGGVMNEGGLVNISNSTLTENAGTYSGGAIYNFAGTVNVTGSDISGNTALYYGESETPTAGYGGGLYNVYGYANVTNSRFYNNMAEQGGGIYQYDTIAYSAAGYSYYGALSLVNCEIVTNSAITGGAIYNDQGLVGLLNSTVTGNAARVGGGLYNKGLLDMTQTAYVPYTVNSYNSILVANIALDEGSFESDVVNANAYGNVDGYNSLSSWSDWSNKDMEGVVNYVYDSTKPLFDEEGYSLAEGSQAIDVGGNQFYGAWFGSEWIDVDYAGNPRLRNGTIDLGAYEYPSGTPSVLLAVVGYSGVYDGQSHSVTLYGVREGDVVYYSEDGENYSTDPLSYSDVGEHTLYLKATREGYADWTSSAMVTISAKQLTVTGTTVADKPYDGTTDAQVAVGTVEGVIEGDVVTVEGSGAFESAEPGEYEVTVVYSLSGADAGNYLAPASEKVPAKITSPVMDITIEGYDGVYDGAAHGVTLTGVQEGDLVYYSEDGITYSTEELTYVEVGSYSVYVKVERTGYQDWTGSATVDIRSNSEIVVTTHLDVVDETDDLVSLREAILAATDGMTVTFDPSLSGRTITLNATLGELAITKSIRIDASALAASPGASGITVNANATQTSARRVFSVTGTEEAPITVSLIGLKITGGYLFEESEESLNLNGGGVFASYADLTITDSVVTRNYARGDSESGNVFISGGGVYLVEGTLSLNNTQVTNNILIATSETGYVWTLGGGVWADGVVTIDDSILSGNYASCGGGFYLENGSLSITSSEISANKTLLTSDGADNVATYGAGIYAASGSVTIVSSQVIGNDSTATSETGTALVSGAGIFTENAALTLIDSEVTGNSASASTEEIATAIGGGIFAGGNLSITGSLIAENFTTADGYSAEAGGGGICSCAITEIVNSTIAANSVTSETVNSYGGGLFIQAGTASVKNSLLVVNMATEGADLYRGATATANSWNSLSSYTEWNNKDSGGSYFVYNESAPLFMDVDSGDFTLAENSQAIDRGGNAYAVYPDGTVITLDLAGAPRIVNRIVDLGAYEYQSGTPEPVVLTAPSIESVASYGLNRHQVVWSAVENASGYALAYSTDQAEWVTITVEGTETSRVVTDLTFGDLVYYRVKAIGDGISYSDSDWSETVSLRVCPMDINGDGIMSGSDLSLISTAWLSRPTSDRWDPRCDIDGDNVIGPGDLNLLSINWLKRSTDSDLRYPFISAAFLPSDLDDSDEEMDWGLADASLDFVNEETVDYFAD